MNYSGDGDGEQVGVAILDNPANPRYAAHWHSRSYGLFAANIFGVNEFTTDPKVDSSMTLEPGKNVRFRYRVIHPGDATADLNWQYTAYVRGSFGTN
jgi:hypothetical protein